MLRSLALALLLALVGVPAAAQAVRGTLQESGRAAPVAGALVVLLDEAGRARGEVLTDAAGRFLLRAPAPGRYTLRADRIGYGSTTSPAIEIPAGETVETTLSAPSRPVTLQALTVTAASRRCTVRPAEGMETSVLWEEARKALRSQSGTERQYPYQYRVRRTFREVDATTLAVRHEESRTLEGFSENPFVAISPEQLSRRGYVEVRGDTIVFNAPDAGVLLSDEFADGYCLRVEPADDEHAGMIGLAFEPAGRAGPGGRRPSGIRGVLWLDQATAELRLLEYGYVHLPPRVEGTGAGGRVEFRRLPNGSWIVPRWRIRMPSGLSQAAAPGGRPNERTGAAPAAPGMQAPPPRQTAATLSEELGEVLEIRTAAGETVAMATFAALTGTVRDSTTGAALPGARVQLMGTDHAATADTAGRFRLEGLSEGVYSVVFEHPRLDTLGYAPTPLRLALVPPQETERDLWIPSWATLRTAACPAAAEGTAPLGGRVATAAGVPLQGAAVTALWQRAGESGDSARAAAVTDEHGEYRICGLPAGLALRVEARAAGAAESAEVRLQGGVPGGQDFAFAADVRIPDAVAALTPPLRVTVRLLDAENGRPIQGATVRFTGDLPQQVTDRRGEIAIEGVPQGTYGLEFQHQTYGSGTSQMAVRGAGESFYELRVPRRVVTLEAVTVTATRVLPADYGRTRRRQSSVLSRERIEARLGVVRNVGDLVRGMIPGLNVRPTFYPGPAYAAAVRGICIEPTGASMPARQLGITNEAGGALATGDARQPAGGNAMDIGTSDCNGVGLVLNDVPVAGDPSEFLRDLPVDDIESIEYVRPMDAAGLFGQMAVRGALVIYTRGYLHGRLR